MFGHSTNSFFDYYITLISKKPHLLGGDCLEVGSLSVSLQAVGAQQLQSSLSNVQNRFQELGRRAGELGKNLSATLTAPVVGGLVAVTEGTRELRQDLGKLDAAFTTNGFTAEQAKDVYHEFYGILGESDTAIEAANHLAKLTNNQKELNEWTTIATGVYATFGDSLPIEGLTEAANETAKVGEVTGPLADAINWAGVSEDKFNESLAACTTEQERQALITETLNDLYTDAADKYREVNGEVIEANKANARLKDSFAELGKTVEPIMTKVVDKVTQLVERFNNLSPATQKTIGIVVGLVAVLGPLLIAISSITGAFATMGPIIIKAGAAIGAISAPVAIAIGAIAAVIAIGVLLYKNWDEVAAKATEIWNGISNFLSTTLDNIKTWMTNTFNNIKNTTISTWENMKNSVITKVVALKDKAIFWLDQLWSYIKSIPSQAVTWGLDIVEGLWQGISNLGNWLYNKVKSFITDNLTGAIKSFLGIASPSQVMAELGVNTVEGLSEGMLSMRENLIATMEAISGDIKDGVKELPDEMRAMGESAATSLSEGLIETIRDKTEELGGVVGDLSDEMWDRIERTPGVGGSSRRSSGGSSSPNDMDEADNDYSRDEINDIIDNSGGLSDADRDRISKTPGVGLPLASGGIVTGPTQALIGEGKYDEAVIPLPNGWRSGGGLGGGDITVNVYGSVGVKDIATQLVSELRLRTGLKI